MLTLPTPPYGLQKSLEKYVESCRCSSGQCLISECIYTHPKAAKWLAVYVVSVHLYLFFTYIYTSSWQQGRNTNDEQNQRPIKEPLMLHIMGPHVESVGRRDAQRQIKLSMNIVSIPFHFKHSVSLCVLYSQCRDWPEIAGNHETDGLPEDWWPGEMCTQRHLELLLCGKRNRFLIISLTNTIMYSVTVHYWF